MLTGLRPAILQRNKSRAIPNTQERLVELVRENGALRREILFYRTCYEEANRLLDRVAGAITSLFVLSYTMPAKIESVDADIRYEVAMDLQEAMNAFIDNVRAEQ